MQTGEQEASVAKFSGESLSLRSGGAAALAAFRNEVRVGGGGRERGGWQACVGSPLY